MVGGGFDSITKITGSLYALLKIPSGESLGRKKLVKPKNALLGIKYGVKGGINEIGEGITGIFVKPVKGAKR